MKPGAMKQFLILLKPITWSLKHNILGLNKSFYRKNLFFVILSVTFIYALTKLLSIGMTRLETLSPDVFKVLLIRGYSFIFLIIFAIQIINGFVIALNSFYQSRDLDTLVMSPVNRTALFFARLIETQLKASWMLAVFGIPLLISAGLQMKASIMYYMYAIILFTVFSSIPANVGVGLSIIVARAFPTGRVKKFLVSFGVIILVTMVILFRMYRPERFVNPALFANVTLFISEIQTTSFILLPNRWLSESIFNFLNKNFSALPLFVSLLFLTSYLSALLSLLLFNSFHYRGWARLQEGSPVHKKQTDEIHHVAVPIRHIFISRIVRKLASVISNESRKFFFKDSLYQFRDIRNVHQLMIILALIIVYILSIASIPMNWEDIVFAQKLKYFIAFFNIGLLAIILSALCARIVYPSVLSEKSSLWIIKSAPVTPHRFIWTKYFFFFLPIVSFGLTLTVFSSYFINVNIQIFILKCVTTALLCSSLVSMALLFSISDMKQLIKEGEKEELKTGNTLYMIISVILIITTLVLELFPIYIYYLGEAGKVVFIAKTWLVIGTIVFALIAVNALITGISITAAIKQFDRIELV